MAQFTGSNANDVLVGTSDADVIHGLDGSDSLDGGAGPDEASGGNGNDYYIVDNPGDRVFEAIGGGYDIVFASISYALASGQEVESLGALSPSGTAGIDLRGNEFANRLVGNAGSNTLDGGGGADDLYGEAGNDYYIVDNAADRVFERLGAGFDIVFTSVSYALAAGQEVESLGTINAAAATSIDLTGNGFANRLVGNAGSNGLNGGAGADELYGEGGNDYYVVDNAGDRVFEAFGGGFDIVFATVSYSLAAGQEVESLGARDAAATTSIDLTGNGFANRLVGNAGSNGLNGGAGADELYGEGGSDYYVVDNAGDRVFEAAGGGFDIVFATVSYSLAAGQEVESLGTTNAAATTSIDLTGNEFANRLVGNAGSNSLNGGAGADDLYGEGGDDYYVVDNAGDHVFEMAGGGFDIVFATGSYALASGQEVESLGALDAAGTSAINLTGNAFANRIVGNAGANVLDGGGGADTLFGLGGADQFLITGAPGPGNVVTIGDFQPGTDRIVLPGAPGQAFEALATGGLDFRSLVIGTAAVSAEDFIIYNSATGALLYDADGSGAGGAIHFATLQPGLALTSGAFLVTGALNNSPIISSGTTATIAENSPTSTIVYQTVASDPDGDRILYTIGGSDASRFTIDQNGAVRLIASADYEVQSVYNIVVVAYDSAGTYNDVRTITVNVTDVIDTPQGGAIPVIQETASNNNSIGAAQFIDRGMFQPSSNSDLFDDDLPSATIRGSIATGSPNADLDFFSITLNAGERLILDIDHSGGDLDAFVRIFDASGNEIGFVDDSPVDPGSQEDRVGTTLDSFLSFRAPATGTYYFSVESWGTGSDNGPGTGETTGSYDLNISIGPPVPAEQAISEDIDALIGSNGWPDPNSGLPGINLTYAFPNSPSDYPSGTSETQSNFEQFNGVQQSAATQMLQMIANVTSLTFTRLFDPQESGATLRYAMSDEPDVAYAYLPGGGLGGTAWFRNSPIEGRSTPSFDNPVPGGYAWMSILHESGHALGLKHGHEFPAVSFERDSVEYTMMTYRSYTGHSPNGYVNETWGFPSTPMMLDIAALQRLYGANFSFNAGATVYTWSPLNGQSFVNGAGGPTPGGNRVFMTIWDGGGNDTYDMSNYAGGVVIDLRPGEFSRTSQSQIANLGQGHFARGNVGNAYLFNGDTRSLIENGIGGGGNDTFHANQAANRFTGGSGNDTFAWIGNATVGSGALADTITDFARGADKLDLAGLDARPGTSGDDAFAFIGTNAFSNVAGQLRYQVEGNDVRIQGDFDGNGVADMEIVLQNVTSLDQNDFFF